MGKPFGLIDPLLASYGSTASGTEGNRRLWNTMHDMNTWGTPLSTSTTPLVSNDWAGPPKQSAYESLISMLGNQVPFSRSSAARPPIAVSAREGMQNYDKGNATYSGGGSGGFGGTSGWSNVNASSSPSVPFTSQSPASILPGGPLAQPIRPWSSVTPSGTASGTASGTTSSWYQRYVAAGGPGTEEEFNAAASDPTNFAKIQAAIIQQEKAKAGTTSGTTSGTSSGTTGGGYENPYASLYSRYRIDPSWIAAYQAQHGGLDPISDYGSSGSSVGQGDNYAPRDWQRTPEQSLQSAEWDKDWGDQYLRTYGKAPDQAAWEGSYQQREALKRRGVQPGG